MWVVPGKLKPNQERNGGIILEKKRTYMAYGFLDFLAYYVPGVVLIVFLIVLNHSISPQIGNPINSINQLSEDAYVRGAIWTILSIIVPYVSGHLIFPLGYLIGKLFFNKSPIKIKQENDLKKESDNCKYLIDDNYCKMEDLEFAECLYKCFQNSNPAFNDLMITRFRTLSRFCRSMLLPTILLALSFGLLFHSYLNKEYSSAWITILIPVSALGILFGSVGFGFGRRYRNYEIRWRNGVCIGSRFL